MHPSFDKPEEALKYPARSNDAHWRPIEVGSQKPLTGAGASPRLLLFSLLLNAFHDFPKVWGNRAGH